MSENDAIFSAEGLTFAYNTEPVIRDASFRIPEGAFVLVRGPSGGGKSTLLRLLARFERAPEGALNYNGRPFADIPARDFHTRVGYMHQKPVIAPGSVRDNLALAFAFRRDAQMPADETLRGHMERLNLAGVPLTHEADELSVGQQQRVAFLRLVLFDPEALLLDEPLASLDEDAAGRVMDWLKELNDNGKTVVLSAHGNNFHVSGGIKVLRVENQNVEFEE